MSKKYVYKKDINHKIEDMGWFQITFISIVIILNGPLFIFLWLSSNYETAFDHFADICDTLASSTFEMEYENPPDDKQSLPPRSL